MYGHFRHAPKNSVSTDFVSFRLVTLLFSMRSYHTLSKLEKDILTRVAHVTMLLCSRVYNGHYLHYLHNCIKYEIFSFLCSQYTIPTRDHNGSVIYLLLGCHREGVCELIINRKFCFFYIFL